jgi:hypothetical protein
MKVCHTFLNGTQFVNYRSLKSIKVLKYIHLQQLIYYNYGKQSV